LPPDEIKLDEQQQPTATLNGNDLARLPPSKSNWMNNNSQPPRQTATTWPDCPVEIKLDEQHEQQQPTATLNGNDLARLPPSKSNWMNNNSQPPR
jgi:hypothetical protein